MQREVQSTPLHPHCTDFGPIPTSPGNAGGGGHSAKARAAAWPSGGKEVRFEVREPPLNLHVVSESESVRGAVLPSHGNAAEGVADAECRAVAPKGSRDGHAGAPSISDGRLTAGVAPTSASRNSSLPSSRTLVGSCSTASSSSTTPYLPTPIHHRIDHGVSDNFITEADPTESSTEKAPVTNEVGAKARPILVHLYDDENGIRQQALHDRNTYVCCACCP